MKVRNTLVFIVAILVTLNSFAQTDSLSSTKRTPPPQAAQPKEEPQVKPEPQLGTLEAAWKPVIMNHYLGIRGGYGVGSARFEPMRHTSSYNGLINLGLTYRFDAPGQKYVGCIEVDLNYMEKGFRYETKLESGIMYSRKYTIVELPILWQPYLPLSKTNSATRFFISAGPYVGYALSSTYRVYEKETDLTIDEGDYGYYPARDNYFEYGVVLGGGIQIAVKKFYIGAEFRYNIMLSDMLKSTEKYPGNPFRSPADQMNGSISIGYRLFTSQNSEKLPKTNNKIPKNPEVGTSPITEADTPSTEKTDTTAEKNLQVNK